MNKQDFTKRSCEGWDFENNKCKYGHDTNGAYLCKGNEVFNLYEENVVPAYKIRLPACIKDE